MGARILGRAPALGAAALAAALVVPAPAEAIVSLTYNAAGDTITVAAGDGETNDLYVQEVVMGGGNVTFQESTPGVNLSAPDGRCFQPGTYAAECDGTGVTTIIVKMGDKGDTLNVPDVSWPVDRGIEVTGGTGIDTVNGSPGRDTLGGGGGTDHLEGDGGRDAMFGGGGKDQLDARDGEADREIDCGKGRDPRAKRDAHLDPPAKSC
jgi:Ca2+-binding RTX toxin-like protein